MKSKAAIVTHQCLTKIKGKTAHGLLRHSERFDICAVIDSDHAGKTTDSILGSDFKSVPIYASLEEMIEKEGQAPQFCITGVATHGGIIPDQVRAELKEALGRKVSVINSLHQFLGDDASCSELAKLQQVEILDIRKPKEKSKLRFWTGEIDQVTSPIVAVLGTDCALGKRTTSQWLVREAKLQNWNAHMIYTGQTGWLQGADYGFIFDCTPNDFISGEMEGAIVDCWKNENPDLIVLEGQSSLRNPSGPCGAEFLLSGRAKGVILQHAPHRKYYDGFEEQRYLIPPVTEEIELIKYYGAEVIAIAMNASGLNKDQIPQEKEKLKKQTGLPVASVREEGCKELFEAVKQWTK